MLLPAPLSSIVDLALNVYAMILIAYALISWVNPDPETPIVRFLEAVTRPLLNPLRRIVPTVGQFDLTILVALGLVYLLRELL